MTLGKGIIRCAKCGVEMDVENFLKPHKCNALKKIFYEQYITFPMLIILMIPLIIFGYNNYSWLTNLLIGIGVWILAYVIQGFINVIVRRI